MIPSNWATEPFKDAAKDVRNDAISDLIDSTVNSMETAIRLAFTWWMDVSGPYAVSEANPVIGFLQGSLAYYVAAGAFISVIVLAGKMALVQNGEPLSQLGQGIFRIFFVSALALPMISMGAELSNGISSGLITASLGKGDVAENVLVMMGLSGGLTAGAGLLLILIIGAVIVLAGLVQFALMLMQMILLPIACGLLPLYASLFAFKQGDQAYRKLVGWIIVFLAFKPAVAIVYSSGFILLGDGSILDSRSLPVAAYQMAQMVFGAILLVLAVFTAPALVNFVIPVSGAVGGGTSSIFAAAGAGVVAMGAVSNGAPAYSPSAPGPSTPPAPPTGASSDGGSVAPAPATGSRSAPQTVGASSVTSAPAGASTGGTVAVVQAASKAAEAVKGQVEGAVS